MQACSGFTQQYDDAMSTYSDAVGTIRQKGYDELVAAQGFFFTLQIVIILLLLFSSCLYLLFTMFIYSMCQHHRACPVKGKVFCIASSNSGALYKIHVL